MGQKGEISKFHAENLHISGATVQNIVTSMVLVPTI
jgi:hypothetical protein